MLSRVKRAGKAFVMVPRTILTPCLSTCGEARGEATALAHVLDKSALRVDESTLYD